MRTLNFSLQKLTAQGAFEPQERGNQDPELGPRAAHEAADCGAQGRGIKGWRSGEHPRGTARERHKELDASRSLGLHPGCLALGFPMYFLARTGLF